MKIGKTTTRQQFVPTALCLMSALLIFSNYGNAEEGKQNGYASSVPKPTLSKVSYGSHGRNVLDFWKAPSATPTPLVVVIHGGGWNGGGKEMVDKFVDTEVLLKAGISVASINYRLIKDCRKLRPPVEGPMHDAARAVQFLRSKADEWNIDKTRVAATGGSAGACTSLWIAYHDDLAEPENKDPVLRESTRLACVAVAWPQTSLDPKQMSEWITNSNYGAHAFGIVGFEKFLKERDTILPWINEYSPYALLDAGDPPTYMFFKNPPAKDRKEKDPTHSTIFGTELERHCVELGVPCEVVFPGSGKVKHATITEYLVASLAAKAK